MKPETIDINEYLTIIQAAKAIGCTRRTLYRVIDRVGADGVVIHAFGKQLVHKSRLPDLKQAYLPFGSKRRSAALKTWGSAGGTQKRINREKAERGR
jgi:hypothetical protein